MGVCGSKMTAEQVAAAARSKEVDRQAKNAWQEEQSKIKLLLLGTGECGKSTIFKQMKILYGENKGFTREEREQSKAVIYANIHSNMEVVLDNADRFTRLQDQGLAKKFRSLPEADQVVIDSRVGGLLKSIWQDPGFQATWAMRGEMQVQDLLQFYMEQIERIQQSDYLPTDQDILRARVRTSGIVEETYVIDGVTFVMYDVGGQRNERKKWIHCFDQVTAVIFVAAISEYNQVLYEDHSMGRMDEAVILFDEICNSKWFKNTSMLLFLNKRDLFAEKLTKIPFRIDSGPNQRYTDFNGPYIIPGTPSADMGSPEFDAGYRAAADYLLRLFLVRNKQKGKEVYHHVTCATDTGNVEVVFNACKDIILKGNLRGSGFMD
jgi:GTPase SAR1 family protein